MTQNASQSGNVTQTNVTQKPTDDAPQGNTTQTNVAPTGDVSQTNNVPETQNDPNIPPANATADVTTNVNP